MYLCRRLEHTGQRGSLILPDISKEAYWDAEVLAAGPGRINARGERVEMQAEVGDRILCDPAAFQHYEPGVSHPTRGFVRDRNVLCVVRAPDFAAVEPAADWLLVDPDPRQEQVTASGVVVIAGSLAGGEERARERGYELLADYEQLLASQRYREQPTPYDRSKMEAGFIEALSKPDYECFAPLLKKAREKSAQRPGASLRELLGDGEEWEAEAPIRLQERIVSGRVVGLGPEVREEVELGARIRWAKEHSVVRLAVAGVLRFLVPQRDLEGVLG